MRYKLMAMSNPVPGQEAEFDRWYAEQHLPDVLAIPGVLSGERFSLEAPPGHWQHLALYEVETDDLGGLMAEIGKRAGTPMMPVTDAIDSTNVFMGFFKPASS